MLLHTVVFHSSVSSVSIAESWTKSKKSISFSKKWTNEVLKKKQWIPESNTNVNFLRLDNKYKLPANNITK